MQQQAAQQLVQAHLRLPGGLASAARCAIAAGLSGDMALIQAALALLVASPDQQEQAGTISALHTLSDLVQHAGSQACARILSELAPALVGLLLKAGPGVQAAALRVSCRLVLR